MWYVLCRLCCVVCCIVRCAVLCCLCSLSSMTSTRNQLYRTSRRPPYPPSPRNEVPSCSKVARFLSLSLCLSLLVFSCVQTTRVSRLVCFACLVLWSVFSLLRRVSSRRPHVCVNDVLSLSVCLSVSLSEMELCVFVCVHVCVCVALYLGPCGCAELVRRWDDHCIMTKWMCAFFQYLVGAKYPRNCTHSTHSRLALSYSYSRSHLETRTITSTLNLCSLTLSTSFTCLSYMPYSPSTLYHPPLSSSPFPFFVLFLPAGVSLCFALPQNRFFVKRHSKKPLEEVCKSWNCRDVLSWDLM